MLFRSTRLDGRIARILFVTEGGMLILLHAFIKKTAENAEIRIESRASAAETVKEIAMSNPHMGSSFDGFLAEEGLLDEATAVAVKRVIAWQIEQEMAAQKLTKTVMAKKMHTSRAALNRLLDETDTSLTLTTLASAAAALGKRMRFELSGI